MNDTDMYIKNHLFNFFDKPLTMDLKNDHNLEYSLKKNIFLDYNVRKDKNKKLFNNKQKCFKKNDERFSNGLSFIKSSSNYFIESYSNDMIKENQIKSKFNINFHCLYYIPEIRYYACEKNISIDDAIKELEKEYKIKDIYINDSYCAPNIESRGVFLSTSIGDDKKRYSLTTITNLNKKTKIFIPSFKIFNKVKDLEVFYAVPATENNKYNFISSGKIKKAKIIIFTDCIDLALANQHWIGTFNNRFDIVWVSYSKIWNPIEKCDFSILENKKVYYVLIDHSQLNRKELINNASIVGKLFLKNNIDFKYISFLDPKKPYINKELYWQTHSSLFQSYDDFLKTDGINHKMPISCKAFNELKNSGWLLNPYILPNSLNIVVGEEGSGKTMLAMCMAYAVENRGMAFKGWSKTNINCMKVLYVNFKAQNLKSKITEEFIKDVFIKRYKNKGSRYFKRIISDDF